MNCRDIPIRLFGHILTTSRKLWVAVAGFIAGLVVIFGGSQENADKVSGAILSGAAVVGYIVGEGLTDAANTNDKGDNK